VVKLAVVVCVALAACNSSGGSSASDFVGSSASVKKGSGGFSASLTAEMSKDGSAGSNANAGGSNTTNPVVSNAGTTAKAGSNVVAMVDPKGSNATTAKAGSNAVAMVDPKAGSTAKAGSNAIDPKTGSGKGSGSAGGAAKLAPVTGGPPRPSEHRGPVKPPPDLAAIKLDLEPNWDRDYDEPGTISFVLNVPGSTDKRVFAFHYGYDVDRAPADREAYKKFLADQKLLDVTLDRQRGAAWYLEGTDARGTPAFRYLVVYGGKRLVCGGYLFKDKDSSALGPDLRDKVVAAAKKICETLSL